MTIYLSQTSKQLSLFEDTPPKKARAVPTNVWEKQKAVIDTQTVKKLIERLDGRVTEYSHGHLKPLLLRLTEDARAFEKAHDLFLQKSKSHPGEDVSISASEIPKRKCRPAEKMLRKLGAEPNADVVVRRVVVLTHLSVKIKVQSQKEGWQDDLASKIRKNAAAISYLCDMRKMLSNGDVQGFISYYEKELTEKKTKASEMLLGDTHLRSIVRVNAKSALAFSQQA